MANSVALFARFDPGSGVAFTEIGETDKLYFQKSGAFAYGTGGAIPSGEYQGGTHIIDASNVEVCDTAHPSNVARGSTTGKAIINGAAEVDVSTVAVNDCFRLTTTCSPAAAITASNIFVYGTAEANPVANLETLGVKQGEAAWSDIGGSGNALSLGTSESAETHNQYFALTVKPSANGSFSGTIKASVTVV